MPINDEARWLVRDALRRADMTQAELARRLGLTQKHVSHVLTGRARMSLEMLDRMLTACGYRLELDAVR